MSGNNNHEKIEDFFKEYAQRFKDALRGKDKVEETADVFAEYFMESSPAGIFCAKNDAKFKKKIPEGNKHYRDIGTKEMSINNIEISKLDDIHYMAKVYWQSVYRKNNSDTIIDFSVIYLLREKNNKLKIFSYLTGDEQKLMKEKGVI
jgi:hypothetical protein